MSSLVGFIIGVFVGCVFGIFVSSLMTVSKCSSCREDRSQISKDDVIDRNEF